MDAIVKEVSQATLLAASYEHFIAYEKYCARTPSGEIFETEQYTCAISGDLSPYMNAVVRTRITPGQDVDACIQDVIDHARRHSVPLGWFLLPGSEPADIGRRLEVYGLKHSGDDPALSVDLRTLPDQVPAQDNLRILEVLDLPGLEQWVSTWAESYGANDTTHQRRLTIRAGLGLGPRSRYRSYLAYLDDKPVATSELFLGAGVAAVVWVGTVPSARRQGIGAAVTLAPLLEARRLGYRIGALTASELGYPVYLRMGFQEMCRFPVYIWDPTL